MTLLIEADGGSRGNPGPAAYGALVRDLSTGQVLVELADHLGVTTNNVAEYSGLIAGLTACREIDPGADVEVRMDSKLVVEQMSGRWKIKHEDMRRLALRARDLLPTGSITFNWVPRALNKSADALANESLDAVERGRSGRIERRPGLATSSDVPTADPTTPVPVTAGEPTGASRPTPAVVGWGPDLGDPMVLTAVRHGVTTATLARTFSGAGGEDHPLSARGLAQVAASAAEVVTRGGGDVLVCSPLLRTRQSADAIAEATGLRPVVVDGLAECRFGQWDGLTFAEVQARWPEHMSAWLTDPEVAPPGGESARQLYDRVGGTLEGLLEQHSGRRVIAVAHVGTIRALVARVLATPLLSMNRMELQPASLTTTTWYADGNASLRGYGEAAHLRDV
ncbi:MAG TPA: bifunctional RNase H/acid phosphatase [Candidatus Nanopelagicales bacterium]